MRLGTARTEHVTVGTCELWTATQGTGVPSVLCHGGPGGYDALGQLSAAIDDLACVHRFDQRGGGRSCAHGPFDVPTLVDDMEHLRRHWGHDRWVVGGHSWGAHLALFYALAHPERASGLVLVSTPPARWGWGPDRRARQRTRVAPAHQDEVSALETRLSVREHPADRARLRALLRTADFADPAHASAAEPPAYAPRPEVVASLERSWQHALARIEEHLPRLDIAAIVLHGAEDPSPSEGARRIAALLRAEWVRVPDAGHFPWLESPDEAARPLRRFLARVAAG